MQCRRAAAEDYIAFQALSEIGLGRLIEQHIDVLDATVLFQSALFSYCIVSARCQIGSQRIFNTRHGILDTLEGLVIWKD